MSLAITYYPAVDRFKLTGGSFTVLSFEGEMSGTPAREYPTAQQGDFFIINRAGQVGGKAVSVDDVLLCITTTGAGPEQVVGASWTVLSNGIAIGAGTTGDFADVNAQNADNLVFVDKAFGDDLTGLRERRDKPFATCGAAKATAVSGDTIVVGPGTWNETNLAKDGVHWRGKRTSHIIYTGAANTGIFDDSSTGANAACSYSVAGFGTIAHRGSSVTTAAACAVKVAQSSSVVSVECDTLDGDNTTATAASVWQNAGSLKINANVINHSGYVTVWWEGGEMYIVAEEITHSGSYVACYMFGLGSVNGWLVAKRIVSTSHVAIFFGSTGRGWVDALEINGFDNAILVSRGVRYYVTAQKISSDNALTTAVIRLQGVGSGTAVGWITVQKITTRGAGPHVSVLNANHNLRLTCQEYEVESGVNPSVIQITGGVANLFGGRITGIASTVTGILQSGGTVNVQGVYINTAANSSGNPITKSGTSVLTLNGCVLVAEATRDSIETDGTAQNVVALGSWANRDPDSNVTITTAGGLTVDSAVV